jgi:D-aminopeptidase
VLRAGEILVRHAWGWANAERRLRFTSTTLFRLCSITKQFTCAVLLDQFPDPLVLNTDLRARLPNLLQSPPTTLQLCHNQSGLRDYWAVAMLHGAAAEAPFAETEAARVIAGTRTLQFTPGARYAYANQNFRLLSEMMQHRTGRSFAELLRACVFDRVDMSNAILAADTRAMPDGTEGYEGYEGTQTSGFRPAKNRIIWTGDAGLGASLDDMIAWERHIDATRDDPTSLHARLSAPVTFADGAPSPYGFGLNRGTEFGRAYIGHGGARRGWRSHRMYLPQERVSIVVMFNHLSNAREAALDVLSAALDIDRPQPPAPTPVPTWAGAWLDPETNLATRIDSFPAGHLRLRYASLLRALGSASGRHCHQPDRHAHASHWRRSGDGASAGEHPHAASTARPRAGTGHRRPLPLR